MEQRRLELDVTWKDLADAAKISVATLGAIRRGVNEPSALNKRRLENALRWAPGSIDAVLAGGDSMPLTAQRSEREPTIAELAAELEAVKRANAEMKRRLDQIEGREEGRQHRQAR